MKTKEIAAKYKIDKDLFEKFLVDENLPFTGLVGYNVKDENVEEYVRRFKEKEAEKARNVEKARQEALRKKQVMAQMLISSGFNFEGYRIVKYSGYISGDDAVQIPRSGVFDKNNNGQNITDALVKIRRKALIELKEAAYDLGCNAVIGVDFDYLTLEPETANLSGGTTYEPYVICVTANGNAVVIEKIEE